MFVVRIAPDIAERFEHFEVRIARIVDALSLHALNLTDRRNANRPRDDTDRLVALLQLLHLAWFLLHLDRIPVDQFANLLLSAGSLG